MSIAFNNKKTSKYCPSLGISSNLTFLNGRWLINKIKQKNKYINFTQCLFIKALGHSLDTTIILLDLMVAGSSAMTKASKKYKNKKSLNITLVDSINPFNLMQNK